MLNSLMNLSELLHLIYFKIQVLLHITILIRVFRETQSQNHTKSETGNLKAYLGSGNEIS